ncbi:MAG: T9SS type A sorting domain-containing protein [Bacteroides sp.]|nr:T9SS type A sorting domain-containing protein [Bacteroides sp.]
MFKSVLVLSLLMISMSAYAKIDCVVVYDKTGAQSIIPIKEASEINFSAQTMNVGSYEFITDNIKRYEFADSANLGIEEMSGDIYRYKIDPTGLIMLPTPITQDVAVYNAQGLKFEISLSDNVIDIRHLPTDVYLVKIGQSTIKFLKK